MTKAIDLRLPSYSQEIHAGEYPQFDGGGEAWCSPTSTSMVVAYWGRGPARSDYAYVYGDYPNAVDPWVDYAARYTFDYHYDGAGNWPFNTAYAAHFGLEAEVTQLRSLAEAEQFIKAGIPLVASIAFQPNKLDGFLFRGTDGHLLVIGGFTAGGDVISYDPASASDATVRHVYDRAQFEKAWMSASGGIVYVIHPASVPLPPLERQLVGLRYQFVDCRWELGTPGAGRELYREGHIPGASFLDVDADLSATPGPRGRHPLPEPDDFARAAGRAGIGAGVFVVAYGNMGGAERSVVAAAPLRPRRLRRHRLRRRGVARSLPGAEAIEPAELHAATARRRHDRGRGARTAAVKSSWSWTRAPRRAGAARRIAIDKVPGRIPGALNAPWNEPPPALPAGELVAYCGSGVTAAVLLHRLHLPGREGSSTPARGASGSSSACRSSALGGRRCRAAEVREVRLPAVRDLRRREPDEEHRGRGPRRMHELHARLFQRAGFPSGGCTARTP